MKKEQSPRDFNDLKSDLAILNKIKAFEMLLSDLLSECHKLIQQGIYGEDGIDGGDGQELLDKIEQHIKVERSHRDVTGLIET